MQLSGKKVAVLVAEGFEGLEYWVTFMRLQEEGAEVFSVGPKLEPVSGKNGLEAQADVTPDRVDSSELDGVVIPAAGPRTSSDDTRRSPTSSAPSTSAARRSVSFVTVDWWRSPRGSWTASRPRVLLESRTTSRTLARDGWTRRPFGKGTWSGDESSRTSRTSTVNW